MWTGLLNFVCGPASWSLWPFFGFRPMAPPGLAWANLAAFGVHLVTVSSVCDPSGPRCRPGAGRRLRLLLGFLAPAGAAIGGGPCGPKPNDGVRDIGDSLGRLWYDGLAGISKAPLGQGVRSCARASETGVSQGNQRISFRRSFNITSAQRSRASELTPWAIRPSVPMLQGITTMTSGDPLAKGGSWNGIHARSRLPESSPPSNSVATTCGAYWLGMTVDLIAGWSPGQ